MQVNYFTILVGSLITFGIISMVTGEIRWGVLAALLIGVGALKWVRVKKQEANEEIEYDERVISNVRKVSLQTFSFANLFLLIVLFISDQFLNQHLIKANYLIFYLIITFFLAFFIVPSIVKNK
jgi:hypothetical protein